MLKLLEGLRGCFHGRKASLLHKPILPTIEEAIARISQEEVWLSLVHPYMKVVPTSTFAVIERSGWSVPNRDPNNCPTRGRGKGYNIGWTGRGRSARGRGGYSRTSGGMAPRGRGVYSGNPRGHRAHMAVAGDIGTLKGKDVDDSDCGDFAHWASIEEGNMDKASLTAKESAPEWALNSMEHLSMLLVNHACSSLTVSILLLTWALYKLLMAQNIMP